MDTSELAHALLWYFAFLFSVTIHEAAHAWAALRGGDPTAYLGGQVSIDPMPHIRREPLGMVVLPLATALLVGWPFGFASAPYDPIWAANYPRRAAWMALAGPAANLLLVLVTAAVIHAGIAVGVFDCPDRLWMTEVVMAPGGGWAQSVATMLSIFFSLNLILFVLNMIPVPPLDGSSAVPLLLSEAAALRYLDFLHGSPLGWLGLFLAWRVFDVIFPPIFYGAVDVLYPWLTYS